MANKLSTPVLVLNKTWSPVHATTVEKAITALSRNKISVIDPENYILYDWNGWLELPVFGEQPYIATRTKRIRLPSIVLLAKYNKVPNFKVKLNMKNVWIRDGGRCMYTGRKIALADATMDHVFPTSRGGKNEWTNVVCCDPEINRKKADRTPKEFGMPVLRQPFEPKWTPLYSSIFASPTVPAEWRPFLKIRDDDAALIRSAFDND